MQLYEAETGPDMPVTLHVKSAKHFLGTINKAQLVLSSRSRTGARQSRISALMRVHSASTVVESTKLSFHLVAGARASSTDRNALNYTSDLSAQERTLQCFIGDWSLGALVLVGLLASASMQL